MTRTVELLQTHRDDETYDRRKRREFTRDEMIRVAQHFARSADPIYMADPETRLELFMQLMANFVLVHLGAAESDS